MKTRAYSVPAVWALAALSASAAVGETVYSPENASREVRFANPPASARILPIHHGRPNDLAKADAEMEALKEQGFGGFAGNVSFHDYLDSPEAWKTYRHAVEKAHALGQSVWLYDEKGYPSCSAGGKTLQGHPEWKARAYLVAVTNVPAGSAALPPSPPGKTVATVRRKTSDGTGEWVYVITDDFIREGTHVSVSVDRFKNDYPNLLMKEPTARFIALTHEAYRRELGPSLKFITSTFTDEPSLMTMWMRTMPYYCLPVSDEFLAAYAAKAGHPLADDVPELVGGAGARACGVPAPRLEALRHRFWTMVGDRVAENFTGQIRKWTDANGIESGGHLLAEESLVGHVCLYGDFFKVLRNLSAPSCDMLQSVPSSVTWLTPLLVGSAGDLNGAKHVMSEASDHCQRYRAKGDTRPVYQVGVREIVGSLNRQIWGGVNTFTSYYNWNPFTVDERVAMNEEIGRTITLVREGVNAAEIALVYPSDALMAGFEPQVHGGGGAAAVRTAGLVRAAGQALFCANRAFMFVDDATLAAAEVRDGRLASGKLAWRTVVLAGVSTLSAEAVRKLEAFRKAGGLVLAFGERPRNSRTAFPDAEVARLTADWTLLPESNAALFGDFVCARHEPALRCVRGPGGALRTSHRRTAAGDVFFVMNDTGDVWSGAVRLAGGGAARVWNPRVGLSSTAAGDIPLDLPPFGGVVLTTTGPVTGRLVPDAGAPFAIALDPLASVEKEVTLGMGTYVKGEAKAGADGWQRVEVRLTKGGVDTFAFLVRSYAASPFAADARGLGFSVRVPASTGGHAHCGVFLRTKDDVNWYAPGHVSLSEKGAFDVTFAFSDFYAHGAKPGAKPSRLRAEDVRSVNFGFGGYFGQEGERVVFEVSRPMAFRLAPRKAADVATPDRRPLARR